MRIPDIRNAPEVELAWAAGFFDGEGCTTTSGRRDHPCITLSIGQRHREVLDKFQVTFGVGTVYGPYVRGDKLLFKYRLNGRRACYLVLTEMWPYLGTEKKLQAKGVFNKVVTGSQLYSV